MLRKILFVDDDPILRAVVEKHLATHVEHFLTILASDGFDALKKLQKFPFSLIVIDLLMPRMDGMSLISHIRDKYPDLPIVIISGMPVEKMRQLAAASDIIAFLSKPFQVDQLVAIIMQTLRKEAEAGIMHDVSPSVFLQLIEMDAKTCTIRILDKASQQGGILYFIDGQLVNARVGAVQGMDAALKVFTWEAASIFFRNDCPPQEDTINSSLQAIIMKAAGMRDESLGPELTDDEEGPQSSFPVAEVPLDEPLPTNDWPPEQILNQAIPCVLQKDADDATGQSACILEDFRAKMEQVVGSPVSAKDVSHEASMDGLVLLLNELGEEGQFGAFQAGYIASGKAYDQVLLPGQPPLVAKVQVNSPRDTIFQILLHKDGG